MKRWVAALASLVLAFQLSATPAAATTHHVVCLDPGHGGSDPGAVRRSLVEAHINLYIAQKLRDALLASPAVSSVVLTRNDNTTSLGNSDRAVICNNAGATVVVSIHLNAGASGNDWSDHFQAFYGKKQKDEKFARSIDANYRIAAVDPAADKDADGQLDHAAVTNFANGTLLKSRAPASLVECLFLSNAVEQQHLSQTYPDDDAVVGDDYPGSARADEIVSALLNALAPWLATH